MSGERVDVLRLGYRRGRDPRITTHLALVGRAFGADRFLLAGDEDKDMFENLESVEKRFGKGLECEYIKSPMGWLRKFVEEDAGDGLPGVAVHLTMYGEPFREAIPKIRRDRPLVVIVGGAKVPPEVFKLSQYNVAVGNQPHSEVAALGLFLDSWYGGNTSERKFEDARLIIEPSAKGKKVIDLDR
ncbi:MAG: tRNA (cytidine(56)-2'-O)-methyltransferase [Candidatus Poseidoniales archaeon]|nr:MAG: tRNA (cytidine(56)-2'-O)-methyltransferase [Candidatus Poseidoniales archaeon]|tara:strand:- start:14441 stop:14998 length:558 start_codon:yes stop_codon:yes gene_type:complete